MPGSVPAPGASNVMKHVSRSLALAERPSPSVARQTARAQGERPIDFLKCRVVIFFVFIFVEVGLLNCINCNPVPRGTRNHPHEAL